MLRVSVFIRPFASSPFLIQLASGCVCCLVLLCVRFILCVHDASGSAARMFLTKPSDRVDEPKRCCPQPFLLLAAEADRYSFSCQVSATSRPQNAPVVLGKPRDRCQSLATSLPTAKTKAEPEPQGTQASQKRRLFRNRLCVPGNGDADKREGPVDQGLAAVCGPGSELERGKRRISLTGATEPPLDQVLLLSLDLEKETSWPRTIAG